MGLIFAFLMAQPALCQTRAVPAETSKSSAPASGKSAWIETASPHFRIFHKAGWLPAGLELELERIYGRMRFDMSLFAPWMEKQRTTVYIYPSRADYAAGEFAPPAWSRGLALYEKRAIAIYDDGDRDKLRGTVAHELAHLFFESFFQGTDSRTKLPPAWLDEGVAVMMEDAAGGSGQWNAALNRSLPERMKPLKTHVALQPGEHDPPEAVEAWYLESFAMVKFLFSPARRLQFKGLCAEIRAGRTAESALWKNYRFKTLSELDTELRLWVSGGGRGGGWKFEPRGVSSFPFTKH
ncbi:MAG: hypothetical protein WC421_00375 [Elusimicrobiales bacterium]